MTESKPLTDDNGDATTPLHEAMADAAEDAVAHPFKEEPKRGLAGEAIDEPTPIPDEPQARATTSGDDEDNAYDSGDDTGAFAAPDDDTRKAVQPIVPGNIFQQYAGSHDARDAAAHFSPKQFGERLTSAAAGGDANEHFGATTDAVQDGDTVSIVGGNSAVLDGNADRLIEGQLHQVTLAGGDTRPLEAVRDAGRAAVLNVRAPMPVTRALNPLAKTVEPL